MNPNWVSINFTGPLATHSLVGDIRYRGTLRNYTGGTGDLSGLRHVYESDVQREARRESERSAQAKAVAKFAARVDVVEGM
jgi:hypothetical protein